jgi:hypothetical protein
MRRALLLAALLLAAALIGRLSAPASSPAPHPGPPGPTSLKSGGAGADYAHSQAGAVAASAGYQQAFADSAILRPGELRKRVEEVATSAFAPRLLAASRPGARRLAQGALGTGLRQKVPTAYFAVPVSYRLDSYTPRRAVLRTWGFTVLGNATTAEPSAYFGTSRLVLVWSQGRWRVAATRASFGPTPKLLTPRRGGEGFELVDLIEGMRRYASAP